MFQIAIPMDTQHEQPELILAVLGHNAPQWPSLELALQTRRLLAVVFLSYGSSPDQFVDQDCFMLCPCYRLLFQLPGDGYSCLSSRSNDAK